MAKVSEHYREIKPSTVIWNVVDLAAWQLEICVTKSCCCKGLHSSDLLKCSRPGLSANFSNTVPLIYESNLKMGHVPLADLCRHWDEVCRKEIGDLNKVCVLYL